MDWSTIPPDLFSAWVTFELNKRQKNPTDPTGPLVEIALLNDTDKAISIKSFLNAKVLDNTDKFNKVDTDAVVTKQALADDNQKASTAIAALPK